MSEKRRHISLKTKLAATLCALVREDENGKFVKIIPHDEAVKLSEDEVISRFEFDHHPIPKAHGGTDTHWNLDPLAKADHRRKTAKVDQPRIAKAKRVTRAHEEFRRRMLAKAEGEARPEPRRAKRKIPSRPFPKRHKSEARP